MENAEQETIKMEETRKQPSRLEVIGAVISLGVLSLFPQIWLLSYLQYHSHPL